VSVHKKFDLEGERLEFKGDGRFTIVLSFFLCLLLFDFSSSHRPSSFHRNKTSSGCEQLHFVQPGTLIIKRCTEESRGREVSIVPAEYAPLFFKPMPINTASKDMLMTVKGVGPTLAENIVAYRNEFGRFTGSEDLLSLPGIGSKRVANLAAAFSFAEVP